MGIGALSHRRGEEGRRRKGKEGKGGGRFEKEVNRRASRAEEREREEWEGEWERRAGLGLDGGVYDRGPLRKEGPQH